MCLIDHDLREELGAWLATLEWSYFLTVTCAIPRKPHQSLSLLTSIKRNLQPFLPSLVFLGTEQHLSSLLHVHGLYRHGLIAVPARVIWQSLFKQFGRSKVEVVRSQEAVSRYCTKYVVKELTDYDIW